MIRLQRRRRAAQQHGDVFDLPALDGDVAAVVARGGVLLVAGLVLFIDDDDAQVRHRREDRRARADDHLAWPLRDLLPVAVPLGGGQAAVEDRDALEAGGEAADGLRRQRDLRHQHDRLLALLDHLADALEIISVLPLPVTPKSRLTPNPSIAVTRGSSWSNTFC